MAWRNEIKQSIKFFFSISQVAQREQAGLVISLSTGLAVVEQNYVNVDVEIMAVKMRTENYLS